MNADFEKHALHPQNQGILPAPDGYAQPQGTCGDTIELFLHISDDTIEQASFVGHGCAFTIACGSMLTELIHGLPLEQAAGVTAETIDQSFGGLPRDHRHCAALAALALKKAVRDFYQRRQASWKTLYSPKQK